MKPYYLLGVIPFFLASMAAVSAAEVFKWIDADGRVHYSDRPQSRSASPMNIKSNPTDKAQIAAQKQARLDAKHAAAADAQVQALKDAEAAQRQEIRAENCRRARQALVSVQNARRLFVPDENGERRYLTDEETVQKRAQAQKDVDEWCGLN